jgi:hypothetical protein
VFAGQTIGICEVDDQIWWPGADQPAKPASDAELPERSEGKGCKQPAVNGFASLTLRAHFVRLSALRASVEPPTRGFSVASWIVLGLIRQ